MTINKAQSKLKTIAGLIRDEAASRYHVSKLVLILADQLESDDRWDSVMHTINYLKNDPVRRAEVNVAFEGIDPTDD